LPHERETAQNYGRRDNQDSATNYKAIRNRGLSFYLNHLNPIFDRNPLAGYIEMTVNIEKYQSGIDEFCRKWNIAEFSLFGSVLRDDFGQDSDIDVLVEFGKNSPYSLFDLVAMKEQLGDLFGREVDILEKAALRNPFRKHSILNNRRILYVT
jgi:uncharacterized protein